MEPVHKHIMGDSGYRTLAWKVGGGTARNGAITEKQMSGTSSVALKLGPRSQKMNDHRGKVLWQNF